MDWDVLRTGIDAEPYIDRINGVILERPAVIILIFLVVTAGFALGLPQLSAGGDDETDSFTDGLPEQEALDAINEEFGDPFTETENDAATSMIQSGSDVLSKESLVRMARLIERADDRGDLRVEGATGPPTIVATAIDPTAQTPTEQRRVLERTSEAEIKDTIREIGASPRIESFVSEDYNPESATATAAVTTVSHDLPPDAGSDASQEIQLTMRSLAQSSDGDLRAFGSGIIDADTANVTGDSLAIVVPVVIILILIFLIVAYRDPVDLMLGLVALIMTLIWTFGFMGHAGIPFSQTMVSVPVLLLAVGVDFGIHAINRYREERVKGYETRKSMRIATRQLVVAFFIVAITTAFGFGANVVSDLGPISDFGLVAATGILFTLLIFGVGMPAAKLALDDARERINFPAFGSQPLASEGSLLGRALSIGATVTRYSPLVFVLVFIAIGGAAADYGQGVDQSFEFEDFLPPEEQPWYIEPLPEAISPGEYTATRDLNFIEENFEGSQDDAVTIYLEGSFTEDHSLEALQQPNDDLPDTFVTRGGEPDTTGILSLIESERAANPEFDALVERNDRNGDGVPDRNLREIYTALEAADAGVDQYLTDDRDAARIEYAVEGDADQGIVAEEAGEFAGQFRQSAVATGQIVVFSAVSDVIFESSIQSLAIAIILTGVFLMVVYGLLEGRPLLGVINMFPILITVALLVATMRLVGLSLNALTATLLSVTIGVGVAYSVHITHRFIDEYNIEPDTYAALVTTLSGTGGALTASMLTTGLGAGALVLAISPILGTFGLLMFISVIYSYLTAIVTLPPALFLWARLDQR